METLRHRDWLTLHEAILHLNGVVNLASLPGRVLDAARWLVPFDTATLQDNRGRTANIPWVRIEQQPWNGNEHWRMGVRAMTEYELPFDPLRDTFFACSAEHHPHTAYFQRTGDGSARRISDVMPTWQLFRSRFYNEISRPMRIRRQLTVYEPLGQGSILFLAACRKGVEFSDHDVTMFELLRPHVAGAWKRALERERLRERLRVCQAAADRAALDDSPAARGALRRRFALTEREAEVLVWLAQGKTNAEIGLILGLSVATVKTHLLHVFGKLGCETRTAAARAALEAFALGDGS